MCATDRLWGAAEYVLVSLVNATLPPRMNKPFSRLGALLAVCLLLGLVLALLATGEMLVRAEGGALVQGGPRGSDHSRGRVVMLHPTLGYTHLPGRFKVTLGDGFVFHMTHGPDTLRVTSGPDPEVSDGRPEIWVLGCSATHGWSLNDEETYPWLLQKKFPGYRVRNFGVSGYGTLQSLIQFREALAAGLPKPKIVLLAYGDFHDARNTLARQRRKEMVPWNRLGPMRQPYARIGPDGELNLFHDEVAYTEFPFMQLSALSNKLESTYDNLEVAFLNSHRVSELLMLQINKVARDNHITFVVAGIWRSAGTEAMRLYAKKNHIPALDISVDTARSEFNNLPHDLHPSALANRHYAEAIGRFFTKEGIL